MHPTTWEMFRNTLASGGLFTALFAASAKLTHAESPADKKAGARDDEEPEAGRNAGGDQGVRCIFSEGRVTRVPDCFGNWGLAELVPR